MGHAVLRLALIIAYIHQTAAIVLPILHALAAYYGNDKGGKGDEQRGDGRKGIPLRPEKALLLQFIASGTILSFFWFVAFLFFQQ